MHKCIQVCTYVYIPLCTVWFVRVCVCVCVCVCVLEELSKMTILKRFCLSFLVLSLPVTELNLMCLQTLILLFLTCFWGNVEDGEGEQRQTKHKGFVLRWFVMFLTASDNVVIEFCLAMH